MPIDTRYFKFGGKDCRDFNIQVSQIDMLMPPKRSRKLSIPLRNGQYDYGSRNYEERIVQLQCLWHNPQQRGEVPRSLLREVAYWLRGKERIILSTDPNIAYIGETFDSPSIMGTYIEYGMVFNLSFICDPFGYDLSATQKLIKTGRNEIKYEGTAETPTMITLHNNTASPIYKVKIITTKIEGD